MLTLKPKPGSVVYIPALSNHFFSQRPRMSWWNSPETRPSPFYYPYALFSYATFVDSDVFRYSRGLEVVYADSGGASNPHTGFIENPINVLRWQESFANVGFTMDEVPSKLKKFRPGTPGYITFQGYEPIEGEVKWRILSRNAKRGVEALKAVRKTDFKLLYVLHAKNEEEVDFNIKELKRYGADINDFDGVALSYKVRDPSVLGRTILYLCNNYLDKGKHIHSLMAGNIVVFPTLVLVNQMLKSEYYMTADSISYDIKATQFRRYIFFYGSNIMDICCGHSGVSLYKGDVDSIIEDVPCLCPVCTEYGKEVFHRTTLMVMHNLYALLQYFFFVNSLPLLNLVKNKEKSELSAKLGWKSTRLDPLYKLVRQVEGRSKGLRRWF